MLRGCGPVVADGQGPAAEASRLRLRQRRGLLPGWAKARKRFLFETATQPWSSFLGTAILVRTKKAGTEGLNSL